MKNIMRRLTALLICVCMIVTFLPAQAIAVDAQSTGTTSNTQDWSGYTSISTKEELNAIRNDLAGKYYLTANIVFTEEDFAEGGAFYNDGAGWIPVGSDFLNSFTGIFDGNGHYISGLQVNNTNSALSGLFGCCKGTIQNLGLVDANIYVETTGSQNAIAGTITGILHKGTITNCYSSGTVLAYRNGNSYSAMAGGIVGQSYTSSISECFNQASVSAADDKTTQAQYVGGIAGHAVSNSVIESCYNTGNVTADGYYGFAGGIAGSTDSITISNCYNTGAVTSVCGDTDKAANAGGIAAGFSGTISNCYNTGSIKAEGVEYANAGGIASFLSGTIEHTYNLGNVTVNDVTYTPYMGAIVGEISSGEIVDCYYLNNLNAGVGKGTDSAVKCTENQLYNSNTYVGFDFETTWEFVEKGNYPTLQSLKVDIDEFASGSGTATDPYHITSARQLNYVRNHLAAYYVLDCDIVFTDEDFVEGGPFYNDGAGWIPIGAETATSFTGVFDGNHHAIKGLNFSITSNSTIYAGLFDQCDGTIKNLGLVDNDFSISTTSATVYVGGIVGNAKNCTIENCYVTGNVAVTAESSFSYVGGIAGSLQNGTIANCFNDGTVSVECQGTFTYVGGIVGVMTSGTVDSCSNYGYALGGYDTGGIVGTIRSGTITNCKNMDTISGAAVEAGGIAGSTSGNDITISACYNTAYVCASKYAGGIVGYQSGGNISDCMNLGKASAENASNSSIYAGGLVGRIASGSLSNSYNIGEVVSWGYYAGGIAGKASSNTISNCYYKDTTSKGVASGTDAGTKCTDAQMQTQGTFTGFDFDKVWKMGDTEAFPYPELKSNSNLYGYIPISSKEELNAIRDGLDKSYYLTTDIVFTAADFAEGGAFFNNGVGWTPIGENYFDSDLEVTINNPFTGTFDGNGHTISGLIIHGAKSRYIGLFGCNEGTIRNVGVINANIEVLDDYGDTAAGGIVGSTEDTVDNCFFSGNITLSTLSGRAYAGGIAGTTGEGTIAISNCYNNGTIVAIAKGLESSYSDSLAGGIVGSVWNGTISGCYNTGSISSSANTRYTSCAGGIAGTVADRGAEITSCFNAGYISTRDCAGGIAGRFYDDATISNCYNTGKIEGTKYAGGITARTNGTISSCYNLGEIICDNGYAGGLVGNTYEFAAEVKGYFWDNELAGIGNCLGDDGTVKCTADQMQQLSTYSDFDFNDIWIIEAEGVYPYPQLRNNKSELDVQSISIAKLPVKLAYLEGKEMLDTAGAMINLNCEKGVYLSIPLTANMVCNFDNLKVGHQELVIAHAGKTCSYEIEIIGKSLDNLTLIAAPTTRTYLEGKDILNVSGGKLALYYNNDTSEEIDITADMVSGFDNTIVGKQTLTVTYEGKTFTYDVEIIAKTLTSIDVTTDPSKLDYLEGKDTLDVTGGKITAYYNNGSTEEIDITADMVSGFDNTIVGIQTITVSYGGKTDTYSVRIIAKSLDRIAVTTLPTKLSYIEGKDTLKVAGGKITLYYNNDSTEEIAITVDMVSGFDNSVVGEQALTVSHNGKTCTYNVTVVAKSVESITMWSLPSKCTYLEHEEVLDVTGGKITVFYNNYSWEEIDITADMVSGFDNSIPGKQTLTVTYGGKTCTYEVEIIAKTLYSIAVTTLPDKLWYLEGMDTLDVAGGKITLFYDNGITEEVDITSDMVSGFDNTVVGEQQLTVTYEDMCCTYSVAVVEKSLDRIAVTATPSQTSYLEGNHVLNVTGGKITLYYNNDTSEEIDITTDMVSGFNNTVIGTQTLTVTYGGKTCYYDVEIIQKSLDSIAVTSQPTTLTYLEGKDALDVSGGKITLYYNNDSSEEIDITSNMVSGFNNAIVGVQTLTVTYNSKICTYDIEIIAKSLDSVALTTSPTKSTYLEGKDNLDVSGGTVTLYYNNDTSEEIVITPNMVSGFDNTVIGRQTLTVTYSGKSCTYDVEIIAKSLDSIAVTSQPTKLTYLEGKDALDVTGGKITLYYNNDSSEEVDITVDMVSGFDNKITGSQTLTVTYKGKTCTYDVEIDVKQLASIAITQKPNKYSYLLGEEVLDVTDGKITLYYNNDTSEEVTMTTDMVTGFDNTVLGTQTLTVEYGGFTDVYQVQIISEDAPQIIVNGGVAANGGIVVVTVVLKNNPGITSMRLKVDYDSSAMSLIGVSDLGKIGNEIHSDQYTDPYVLCWANDTVTENFTANGDIVNLTFQISDTAALGTYEVSVSYDYEKADIHNAQVEKVKFYTVAGKVDVVDVLIGDVNGDGSLDTLDRLTLSRYLANWKGYTIDTINAIGADINCDGSIDTLDRLILSRHLANWAGYEDITNPAA